MFKFRKQLFGFVIASLLTQTVSAQKSMEDVKNELAGQANVITTAVPFLTIAPDSRSGGMGETGVATEPDVWSMHWNPSKVAFADKDFSVGISYTPWLRNLGISDINLAYLAGYKKLDENQTLSASLLYFSLGNIQFTDDDGQPLGYEYSPHEYALDAGYSRKLAKTFSLGVAGRFIYTNLLGNYTEDSKPGISAAVDVSGYYRNEIKIQGYPAILSMGFDISNVGAKISYSTNGEKNFIPTNLRLGAGLKTDIDNYNQIGAYFDANKLLVPSPSVMYNDGESTEEYGRDNNISLMQGIFESFNDAPGGGKEELHEIQFSGGIEYWYAKQFGLRGGYFYEHETKGNRKFFTLGLGLRLNVFGIDFAYLIPTQGKSSPLANTLRFSLTFDFEGLKKEEKSLQQ